MTEQGWDKADFHCGRCHGQAFSATTQAEYVLKYTAHQLAHDLLDAPTPEERHAIIDAALAQVT